MSVRVNDRRESKTNFVYETRNLAIMIGKLVANKPRKYRANFGDHLIKVSARAWELTQMANTIYMSKTTPKVEREVRERCLIEAKGKIRHISSYTTYFLEMTVGESDSDSKQMNMEKSYKKMAEIGKKCGEICKMIDGVIKHDRLLVE